MATPSTMRTVSFYSLPRTLQDRLRGAIVDGLAPAPLARQAGGPRRERLGFAITGGALLAVVVLFLVGYGSLTSSLSRHGLVALALFVALPAAAVFAYVEARKHLSTVASFPVPRGVYLFPSCVIDATTAELRVYPLVEGQLSGAGSAVTAAFPGRSFTFAADATSPADLAGAAREAQSSLSAALAANDQDRLTELDPLLEPRFSSPVGPGAAFQLRIPAWERLGWAIGLGVGVVFGGTTFVMRNATSDALRFSRARRDDTAASYRSYLLYGTTHAREVERTLLPRAALREASARSTVEAIREFRATFPDTDIEPEVDEALHVAMLAELERAKAVGKLSALTAFAAAYPDHGLAKELGAAKHAIYMKERARITAALPASARAQTEPAITELLAAVERLGPTVEVRFRRRPGGRFGLADKTIAKTPTWNGPISYLTRYFDAAHHKAREEELAKALVAGLASLFDPELVTVVASAAEPDTTRFEDPLPSVTVPTLFVLHGADWSGHTYTSRKPRVTIMGLNFHFEGALVLPPGARKYDVKDKVWKGVTVPQIHASGSEPGIEERLYGDMARGAYEAFQKRLLADFLPP